MPAKLSKEKAVWRCASHRTPKTRPYWLWRPIAVAPQASPQINPHFRCPSEMRTKGSHFRGSSWVNPAPSALSLDPFQIVISDCLRTHWNSFTPKGLLGFPPSGYEISGLNPSRRKRAPGRRRCARTELFHPSGKLCCELKQLALPSRVQCKPDRV